MIRIQQEPPSVIPQLIDISPRFTVRSILDVHESPGGYVLTERPVAPYEKDYDADAGEGPLNWGKRFDVSSWGIFGAWAGNERVGSAVIVARAEGIDMLERRDDLAVLWDIRVQPQFRGKDIGGQLFAQAVDWATRQGVTTLKIETQNVNVAACRFYERQGCMIGTVHPNAYPGHPDETQLLWFRDLPWSRA